jgi:hypothetical protein
VAGGAAGDEAAWRDLIANYAREPGPEGGDVPWPERENLSAPRPAASLADPDTDPAMKIDLSDDTDPALDLGDDFGREPGPGGPLPGTGWWPGSGPLMGPWPGRGPLPGPAGPGYPGERPGAALPPGPGPRPGAPRPGAPRPGAPRPDPGGRAAGRDELREDGQAREQAREEDQARVVRRARPVPPAPDDGEDFVPPEPPPLPSLSPVVKGAWAALFGGPGYLLVATMAGWAVPGWAAFLAVAAFVAGFAVLVIQLGDRPPRDSGPDDGAVV